MRCQDIVKRNVQCLTPKDTAQTAARKMREGNIGFLPVCDDAKKVIGTVTDRDLALRLIADAKPATTAIADVMTKEIVACAPQDDVQRAQQLMGERHKSRILCVEGGGKLVGVISLSDIAERVDGAQAAQTMKQVSQRETRGARV